MGMKISAFGRSEHSQEKIKQFGIEKYVIEIKVFLYLKIVFRYSTDLKELLPNVDYIISIMPQTPFTTDLLGNDILSICQKKVY